MFFLFFVSMSSAMIRNKVLNTKNEEISASEKVERICSSFYRCKTEILMSTKNCSVKDQVYEHLDQFLKLKFGENIKEVDKDCYFKLNLNYTEFNLSDILSFCNRFSLYYQTENELMIFRPQRVTVTQGLDEIRKHFLLMAGKKRLEFPRKLPLIINNDFCVTKDFIEEAESFSFKFYENEEMRMEGYFVESGNSWAYVCGNTIYTNFTPLKKTESLGSLESVETIGSLESIGSFTSLESLETLEYLESLEFLENLIGWKVSFIVLDSANRLIV